ncbi:C-type lectin domain family 12 member B-like isoform X1 [Perca fluviatilis]|uniref:C-type lectin domain family 12 member B-like isoform X1 n=1 Tax=Perca fluviatilis TaxID=8168 RepID=UPI00196376CA|nr:C-type lectin domain family 12 member B-like isoform X1 [Perca fluviatilis]
MSEDIYAKADMSKKVRYNRTVQEDKGEWEERTVVIYESTDVIRDDHTDNWSHGGGPDTERHPPAVQRKTFRAAALCLAVLCFLMMTGIILLSVYLSLRQTRYDQLSKNNTHLQSSFETLSVNHSQLQDELKQLKDRTEVTLLQTRYDQLINNYSWLQSSYQTLSVNHSQLQDEVKKLKNRIKVVVKSCPHGWTRFGHSWYFKSEEKKTWYDSRDDCQQRGADLVVINNDEEQEFVTELSKDGEFWIGLWYEWTQREWKWVDGSPLTEKFWAAGQPLHDSEWNPGTCCDQQGKWTQGYYNDNRKWICEKIII